MTATELTTDGEIEALTGALGAIASGAIGGHAAPISGEASVVRA